MVYGCLHVALRLPAGAVAHLSPAMQFHARALNAAATVAADAAFATSPSPSTAGP